MQSVHTQSACLMVFWNIILCISIGMFPRKPCGNGVAKYGLLSTNKERIFCSLQNLCGNWGNRIIDVWTIGGWLYLLLLNLLTSDSNSVEWLFCCSGCNSIVESVASSSCVSSNTEGVKLNDNNFLLNFPVIVHTISSAIWLSYNNFLEWMTLNGMIDNTLEIIFLLQSLFTNEHPI